MATRNYSSVYKIKEFAMSELAPKYFNMEEVNDLNIGLLGYTTELLGSIGEDSFNTITTYMNEMFPNLAVLPESIFNYGALFQIDATFATASECDMLLFIPEEHVLKYATKVPNTTDLFEFYLDNDMTISVENVRFKPDYAIKINYKKYRNDIIYTAMYDMREYNAVYKNSISTVTNPYIKLKRINFENTKYIQLDIRTHQVDRYDINDNVVDTTIINLPKYVIEYDDYLANFEVFYKEANSNVYTQLEKRMLGSSPSKNPFCYYKAIDDSRIEISFTSRDNYFQPEYNSEINISYYTTTGEAGNFLEYTGSNIQVISASEVYDYNKNITLFAIPMAGSYHGKNPMSIDEMKNNVIEKFSTVSSYTNENDLQLYFDNFNREFNSNILFLKKRDDVFERLFNAFVLLKDDTDEIYSTNTLKLQLKPSDFDEELIQSDTYVLKPGHVFKYKSDILDMVEPVKGVTLSNYQSITGEEFLYSNPFLIYLSKSPAGLGFYLTTFENKHLVDYSYVNNNSIIQFICNSVTISRDGVTGSNKYKISVTVSPTTDLDNPMVIEDRDPVTNAVISTVINDTITVRLIVTDNDDQSSICYLDMKIESWDLANDAYTFSCEIETDDYILSNNRFRVLNMYDSSTNELNAQQIIPMTDCVLKIETGYKYIDNPNVVVHTNTYTTESDPVTFIRPIKMMRSASKYVCNGDGEVLADGTVVGGTYDILIDSIPLVKASTLATIDIYKKFYNTISTQYSYIENIIYLITNNYAVDIKLYNTYGRSKNFYIDTDENTKIDKVNIRIGFKVHPQFGTDTLELERDIKIFIKEYIENINNSGTNTFYISNLITELENTFSSIEYLKFTGINQYNTDVQAIINKTTNLDTLTKEERINYVPEYLTVSLDDIIIDIV